MSSKTEVDHAARPLADRMRPRTPDAVLGQGHLLDPGRPLWLAFEHRRLHSMILWGPPGSGKTTLARLLAEHSGAQFVSLSAVTSGVKDVRSAVDCAREAARAGRATVLFVDEVHRFNKSQQDAFLPHIEDGTIILIGATTENPAFALNNALLSRVQVYVLKAIEPEQIEAILQRALDDPESGMPRPVRVAPGVLADIARNADGDARQGLGLLELAVESRDGSEGMLDSQALERAMSARIHRFDKRGDLYYEEISAVHKSIRGSNPDAALYWITRMLDEGCDPQYLLRRMVRIASEDIGNADPRAIALGLAAWDTYDRLGSPEGELAIAQAAVYMACAPKSNAVYRAFGAAREDVRENGSYRVPVHLRNAPTALQQRLGFGRNYRYAHDEADGYSAGQTYFPDELGERTYYHPVERGLEQRIAERLRQLRKP